MTIEPIWCLIGAALLFFLLAIAALTARPPQLGHMHPGQLLRGCIALSFVLLALVIIAIAVVTRY